MGEGLSESRFNMWRAVVAMAHVDCVVKPHEIHFIIENTRDLPMSASQRRALSEDMVNPCSMQAVFDKITSPRDKEDFFHLARAICWSDGNFDQSEQSLIDHLKAVSLRSEDRRAMASAQVRFQGVFIDGTEQANDPGFFKFVKELMGAKAT